MPDPNVAWGNPTTARMLEMLPPFLQDSPDYQGVIHAYAREFDRAEALLEQVRSQFDPAKADLLLGAWEALLRTTVNPPRIAVAERQQTVVSLLHRLLTSAEGRDWEAQVGQIIGTAGWTHYEHDPADPGSPAPGTLLIVLPVEPTSSNYSAYATAIATITPANLELLFEFVGGFLLDLSAMDRDTFAF